VHQADGGRGLRQCKPHDVGVGEQLGQSAHAVHALGGSAAACHPDDLVPAAEQSVRDHRRDGAVYGDDRADVGQ
jgi:hypothetical protein